MTPKQRDKYLQSKYGMSLKQYNAQLKAQKNSCAMCGKHKSNYTKSLSVDHNHKSGLTRGIVCYYCNKFRIGRHDLKSALLLYEYMMKYEGTL